MRKQDMDGGGRSKRLLCLLHGSFSQTQGACVGGENLYKIQFNKSVSQYNNYI